MKKPTAHDKHQQDLVDILLEEDRYAGIITNAEYGNGSRVIGEIDVIGIYSRMMDFYEVKGFPSKAQIKKALDQLGRAREYFKKDLDGENFIYTPVTGIITPEQGIIMLMS